MSTMGTVARLGEKSRLAARVVNFALPAMALTYVNWAE